jgi:hypothetical protein
MQTSVHCAPTAGSNDSTSHHEKQQLLLSSLVPPRPVRPDIAWPPYLKSLLCQQGGSEFRRLAKETAAATENAMQAGSPLSVLPLPIYLASCIAPPRPI